MEFRARSPTSRRAGVGVAVIVVVIVVIILVASVGAFYALSSKSTSTPQSGSSSSSKSTSKSTSSSATIKSLTSSAGQGTSTQSGALTYYSGSFNYSIPVGPSGVRSLPNGTAQYYNSTQVASGTFTFFIASDNFSGSGTGKGTITVTTTGFCSGSQTIPYTFTIPDATTLLGGNLTVFFADPVPVNYSVPLTCTGNMQGVSTATNNPYPYLAEYPGEITVPLTSLPVSEVFYGTPSTTFTWGYSLKETS